MGPERLADIAEYLAGFYPPGTRMDWDDALYRVEVAFEIDLPENMTAPEIVAIKRAVSRYRRAVAGG